MRSARWPVVWLALALAGIAPARAQVVILTAPSEFLTVTTLVDFENFPLGGGVPHSSGDLDDEWMTVGVLLKDDSVGNGISAYSGTFSQLPVSGTRGVADSVNGPGGFVEFTFVVPGTSTPMTVQEAGIWVLNGDNPSTVAFFDASGSLIQTLTPAAGTTFAGLRASQGIASLRVTDGDFYLTDNLQFTAVPEPGTVALMGLGLAALVLGRRRGLHRGT